MNKLLSLLDLFRKGNAVASPELWKKRQITATILAGLILAVVNVSTAFGYALPIDIDTANAIAGGIIGIVNVILTITTTEKIGLPEKQPEPENMETSELIPEVQRVEKDENPKEDSINPRTRFGPN